jgi:ferredoxin--NADP+ reductase
MIATDTEVLERKTSAYFTEQVTWVHHWTDRLFSLRTTRDPALRFSSGQFVMLGLMIEGRPLVRAYSIASPHWDDGLEFYSIKVDDGPLTSRLKQVEPGDLVLVGRKSTGTLVMDGLRPGRTLYLLSTGTGLAPFLSVIRDPDVYERYERVVVTHTCRSVADLSYRNLLSSGLFEDEDLGDLVAGKLIYHPTVTRGPFQSRGRITDLMRSGKFFADLGLPYLDPAHDRLMLCGSPQFLRDCKEIVSRIGFEEGSIASPGDYVIEKAFVES